MGFFSSIVNFIKDVIHSIVSFISDVVGSVFGNSPLAPVLVALSILAIAVWIAGPALIADLLTTTPWDLLEFFPTLCAYAANAIVAIVTLVMPEFGRALGFITGIASFILALPTIATWSGLTHSFTAENLFLTLFGLTSLTSAQALSLFDAFGTFTTLAFVTAATGGPDNPFIQGYIDGFFALPVVVAAAVDSSLSSAGSVMWLALGLAGMYVLSNRSAPHNTSLTVRNEPVGVS